jgi:hypothetical protein
MLHMVELHYSANEREPLLRYFEEHGATHHSGNVSIVGGWVASGEHVVYLVAKSESARQVEQAASQLREFGDVQWRRVVSLEEFSR